MVEPLYYLYSWVYPIDREVTGELLRVSRVLPVAGFLEGWELLGKVQGGREQWVPGDTTGSYRRTVMYHIFMEYII